MLCDTESIGSSTADGMYVCMAITYNCSIDQPGNVTKPACGQLNSENEVSLLQILPW